MKKKAIKWFEHLFTMNETRIPKMVYELELDRRRRSERQPRS